MKSLLKITQTLILFAGFGITTVIAQPAEFYGMSFKGGEYTAGTIFKTDSGGNNLTSVYTFFSYDGSMPLSSLCKAGNSKLYGVTFYGGSDDYGVLYEWDPATDTYTKKIDFDGIGKGKNPYGSLMEAENGKLYGMTNWGGENDLGVLYEYDPMSNSFTKKLDFNGLENGKNPQGSMIQADNGKIYGMTTMGGTYDLGVLFEWDPVTDLYIKKHDFNGEPDGSFPYGSLVQADNGKLYGMTSVGGKNDFGILFNWDITNNIFTKVLDFNGSVNGSNPKGSLVKANNGILLGTTAYGGSNDNGVLFKWNSFTDTCVYILDFNRDVNGAYPVGSLVSANNGKYYITTSDNKIVEWDSVSCTLTKIYDFSADTTRSGGSSPKGSLTLAGDGKLYGTTMEGGVGSCCQSGNGTLYELDPETNIFVKKLDFSGATNGRHPTDKLVRANNGKLYGMTSKGGESDQGVLFEWNPATNVFIKKVDFSRNNGANPLGSLMIADNGKLYGMAGGGAEGCGVLFEWDPYTETYTTKLNFNGEDNGRSPYGSLIQAENGKLYGTTGYGGVHQMGVLFEWDPSTDSYSKLLDFNGEENGSNPYGSLFEANNGKLYGMTYRGGEYDFGVLYEWEPAGNIFTKKLDFNGTEYGSNPFSSLIQAGNGKLYGMTEFGGANDLGVLFEWNPVTDSCIKKIDFDGVQYGLNPKGSLMQASNGKLYGMTSREHINDMGVLFEWDPVTGVFTQKLNSGGEKKTTISNLSQLEKDIDGKFKLNGSASMNFHGSLMEMIYETYFKLNADTCYSYLSPSGSYWWTMSGIYHDTIPNISGYDSIITVNLTIRNADITVSQNQAVLTSNASDATYQWIDYDTKTAIDGETHKIFTAANDGNYAVIVTQNGCIDTSIVYAVTLTGQIESNFKHTISLYPNPSDGSFFIDLGSIYPKVEITLSELDGRILRKEYIINDSSIHLQFSEAPGLYLVIVAAANEKAVFKLTLY